MGCATVEKQEPILPIEEHPYRHIDLYIKELPKITVIVPDYAVDYIHDLDQSFVVPLSKSIVMVYFTKAGPNLKNPGHAVAIIFDASRGYMPLLFQTTIGEEQRFFYYVNDYDEGVGPIAEITKSLYRDYLQFLIEDDENQNRIK